MPLLTLLAREMSHSSLPTAYIPIVMPYPGTLGAPLFNGQKITHFLDLYDQLCSDYRLSEFEKIYRLPWYCEFFIGKYVRLLIKDADWVAARSILRREYKENDLDQLMYSREFLEALRKKSRSEDDDLLHYCQLFPSIRSDVERTIFLRDLLTFLLAWRRALHIWLDCSDSDFLLYDWRGFPVEKPGLDCLDGDFILVWLRRYWRAKRPYRPTPILIFHLYPPINYLYLNYDFDPRDGIFFSADFMTQTFVGLFIWMTGLPICDLGFICWFASLLVCFWCQGTTPQWEGTYVMGGRPSVGWRPALSE